MNETELILRFCQHHEFEYLQHFMDVFANCDLHTQFFLFILRFYLTLVSLLYSHLATTPCSKPYKI